MKRITTINIDTKLRTIHVNNEWDESKHKRDDGGKFTSGGGSGKTASDKTDPDDNLTVADIKDRLKKAEGTPNTYLAGTATLKAFAENFNMSISAAQRAAEKYGNAFYLAVTRNKPERWAMLFGEEILDDGKK